MWMWAGFSVICRRNVTHRQIVPAQRILPRVAVPVLKEHESLTSSTPAQPREGSLASTAAVNQ